MKAHSNLPNHDTWKNYEHNQQFTVHSRYNDGVPRSSISLEQLKTIYAIPFNSLIEQCLMEEQELISQILPPTIHYTQHPTIGHSVAPPAKQTPQTNPLFEQWLFEDQFHDSDLEPTHYWDDDYQKVNMYYKAKWPNGSPPHQNQPSHAWDEDYYKVDKYYKDKWPNGSPPHQNHPTHTWDEDYYKVDMYYQDKWPFRPPFSLHH